MSRDGKDPAGPSRPPVGRGGERTLALLLVLLLVGFSAVGCTRYVEVDRGPQAYYQTSFPLRDTSRELERILESVHRTTVTAVYRTYHFSEESAPWELSELESLEEAVRAGAADTATVEESRAATAVLLSRSEGKLLLLTANHAVEFPDTVVERFGRQSGVGAEPAPSRPIRSVAVLAHRTNFVVGLPDLERFEVLARDERRDLAFLGVEVSEDEDLEGIRVLPVRAGDSERLSWGSFVYVLGYPAGYPTVTRGIVSSPRAEVTPSFVIDGLWNRGMSGGLILAVRGEGEELEWVGMARAAAARTEHRLIPEEGAEEEYEPGVPYDGPIYLEEERRIQYGITLSVSMEAIRSFAGERRTHLEEGDYRLPDW